MLGLIMNCRVFCLGLVPNFISESKNNIMNKNEILILLVDDEPDILEMVGYNLSSEGYRIMTAENGSQAVDLAKKNVPHLIIMDVMMPELDGMEACEQMRKIPELDKTIITFLTARGEDFSQLVGLEAGADDYMTKPIKPKVLLSKVKALLRRAQQETQANQLVFDGLTIDRDRYVIVNMGEEILLPRKQFELLWLLASIPGRVFSREEILERIWDNESVVGGRTIDVHIRKLREKIGDHRFQTIKGIGYKFIE